MTCLKATATFILLSGMFLLIANIFSGVGVEHTPKFKEPMQIEQKEQDENLFRNGTTKYEGWARHPIWRYMRSFVKANPLRIKEWDYYATYIAPLNIYICTTVSDLGYIGLYSLSVIDLNEKKFSQKDRFTPLPLGTIRLPPTSLHEHTLTYNGIGLQMRIQKYHHVRRLQVNSSGIVLPNGQKGIYIDLHMHHPTGNESLNIQTSWAHNRYNFYMNEKVNGMPTYGSVVMGDQTYNITNGSYTVLDFGRGYWPYSSTWYWGSATGVLDDGQKIGFNLGYGFSDRTPASENCIFYKGKIHKLSEIEFHIPSNPMDTWTITSDNGHFEGKFTPIVLRHADSNLLVLRSLQNQYFGNYSGTLKLTNGREIKFENIPGFAEKVYSRW
ncbi:hypothetical protein TVAG_033430 [Trichomonas vaginalis G3]|uniref:DUF2804 domain-containing protein n=1 Tax=Trichomonas vaginalis (strain ATCC PRA-98 / G3) TaxID=412133 RepID=A2FJ08_TRIV3|nr:protein of unknown function, DUF2804 [Trichomonas vaginalis G3]EAX95123.1 hypothetical protein TVAG_033430 [Trichomonas vaginalis G3]KAI5524612.1 protein of unknown function, DUF2804 [Trichomonas vaginalis G3]|eukprot:XP_001308053.1 hypothetical protein [Trichomonas vaginalis G3]